MLSAATLRAQIPPDVSYSDDFQSYGTQKSPTGWIDTSVGTVKPTAAGLYKTWPDPIVGNQATNIVYGTKQSSGKPDGNNPRIGTFSTYTTKTFLGKGRFEYRGRFIRTNSDTRIGLTFFSSYPGKDSYYLIGLWSQPNTAGLAASTAQAIVADGTIGVTFVDATTLTAPKVVGTEAIGGNSWDAVLTGGRLYVANETGIVVVPNVIAAPVVNAMGITVGAATGGATVSGAATAITGAATPLTVEVRDVTSGAKVSGVAVAGDGSFTATVAASAGDVMAVVATDGNGKSSPMVTVGTVPFGTSVTVVPITTAMTGDGNYRARRLATDGQYLLAQTWPGNGFDSARVEVFNIASGTPAFVQNVALGGNTRDVVVRNGVAYTADASRGLTALDLSATPIAAVRPLTDCTGNNAVAVDGTYAYVGGDCNGRDYITMFDLTNPKSPVRLRGQYIGLAAPYTQLIPYGNYLIGISPWAWNGVSRDVVVIDKRDVNNLVKVGELDIPNFTGFRGRIAGSTLYLAGDTGVALVDLSTPTAPSVLSTIATLLPRAVDVDPVKMLVYVADSCPGLTVLDVANPTSPRLVGTQALGGNSWDLMLSGTNIYLASEQMLNVISQTAPVAPATVGASTESINTPRLPVAAPPPFSVDRALISIVETSGSVVIRGARGFVAGPPPLSISIRNETLGITLPVVSVAADGSFEASLGGAPGDHFILEATSGSGDHTAIDLGVVPGAAGQASLNRSTQALAGGSWAEAVGNATGTIGNAVIGPESVSVIATGRVPLTPLARIARLEARANDVRADGNRPSATAPTPILRQ